MFRLVLLSTFFVVGLVVLRVMVAPLAIPLSGLVAEGIAERTNAEVNIESVSVRLGIGRIHLYVRDLRVASERFAANIDEVDMVQGFFGGARELVVRGPQMRLDPTGSGGAIVLPDPSVALPLLDRALAQALTDAKKGGLSNVTILDGRIDLISPRRPITEARVFQNVTATLDVADALLLTARMVGAGGPITLDLERLPTEEGHRIAISAGGIVPKDLAPIKPVQDGFALSPRLDARFDSTGAFTGATLDLDVSEGTVIFGIDPPRVLDSARMRFVIRGDDPAIAIEEAVFEAGGTLVGIGGSLTPGPEPTAPWTFALLAKDAIFNAPDVNAAPVIIDTLDVSGRLDLPNKIIHFDTLSGISETGRVDARLDFDFSDGPRLSGAARLGPSLIPTLLGAWPPVVAYDPRIAVMNTVLGGVVREGEVELALTPLELDGDPTTSDMIEGGMSIDIAFADVAFTTPELPIAVQHAHGLFRMRDKTLMARIDGGVVNAGEGGQLRLLEGTFTIPTLGAKPAMAELTATVEGPLSAVVSLAHLFKLPQLKETDLEPGDVTGTVRADLRMTTPLGPNVKDSDRRWSIDARLTDAGSAVPIGGQKVENANLEVLINPRRLAARGRASIDGLKVDVNYSELFAGEKSGAARFVLTDKDRRDRGFDTGSAVRGPVVVTIEQGAEAGRSFSADLTEAEVEIPGFTKAAGESLIAEGQMTGEGGSIALNDLRLDGKGINVAGRVAIENGGLSVADISTFGLSQGDRAKLKITGEGKGYRVAFDASVFDARKLVKSLGSMSDNGGEKSKMPPLTIAAKAQRLRVADDGVISNVTLDAQQDGDRLSRLSLTGLIDGVNAGSFAVQMAPSTGTDRRLQADMTELGRLLSAFDIYERMRGGRTTLDARMAPDGAITGRVIVRDFVLANERTLEEIIARSERANANSSTGRNPLPLSFQAAKGAVSEGMSFDRLVIDFEKKGDVITIIEAILTGNVIGGTANGIVNLKSKDMTLNGTLIPAYGVNNLFGRVPVVGQILGGGDRGGLIGVTFRLAGPLKGPELWVNPISAIAPGIFRKIFEFR
ncbi:AsmA-like C-terminal domain-containing protein [Acuticoccus kandeliae]|uniref:AsmA-like C-terminal domain-containing protein n=1 Tax=Acuticoccus kandeliae TaxID=2073160 RepID=UPI000D3EA57E|nr:AsmA-like C-terminal domain-containing protein [Acuticoccus kandeliae]